MAQEGDAVRWGWPAAVLAAILTGPGVCCGLNRVVVGKSWVVGLK